MYKCKKCGTPVNSRELNAVWVKSKTGKFHYVVCGRCAMCHCPALREYTEDDTGNIVSTMYAKHRRAPRRG